MISKRVRSLALVLVAVLFMGAGLAACGGDDDDAASTTTTEAEEETTTTTEAEEFDPGEDEGEDEGEEGEGDQREAIEEFTDGLNDEIDPEESEGYTFVSLEDDTGQLTVEAPEEWSDVDGRTSTLGTLTLPDIRASTDLEQYNSTFDVPGFQFTATADSTTGDVDAVLDEYAVRFSESCDRLDRQPYDDPLYTGVSQVFENCGGTPNGFVWVVVEPKDTSDGFYIASVGVQIVTDADIDALGQILDTFVVTPR